MGAKLLLAGMVVASVAAVASSGRKRERPAPPPVAHAPEKPWLSREAAHQVLDGARLGPLFAGIIVGGSTPLPEQRARIAEFAREHDVRIDLEIADDTLTAIEFSVEYSGCCGYEEAELLARSAGQPTTGGGCMGPWPVTHWSNWTVALDDGTYVRAALDVNRLTLRWVPQLSLDEMLVRAEQLLGERTSSVPMLGGPVSSAEWLPVDVPFAQTNGWPFDGPVRVRAENGRVTSVMLQLGEAVEGAQLRARWGRPRVTPPTEETLGHWTWKRPRAEIEATMDDGRSPFITLTAR